MSARLKKLPPGDMFTLEVAASFLGYESPDQLLLMELHGEAALLDQELEGGRSIKAVTRAELERLHSSKTTRPAYNTIERRNHLKMLAILADSYGPPAIRGQPWAQAKDLLMKAAAKGIHCPFGDDTLAKALREGRVLSGEKAEEEPPARAA